MDDGVTEVLDRLRAGRSTTWLQGIDDARLDEPAATDPDAEAVVEPYRWFLERIGAGVKLSQAGWLPPAVVVETMAALGEDRYWGKGNRESLAIPVLVFRESATRFGLVRKSKGELLPTRIGRGFVTDPSGLWWHLAGRLPDGRSRAERQAGVLVLLLTAAGEPLDNRAIAAGMSVLGWRRPDYQPLGTDDARSAARETVDLFRRLHLLPTPRYGDPEPPPSPGAVALARAALLGRDAVVVVPPLQPQGQQQSIELTVTLADIEPPIFRRLVVPASSTLAQTHEVLQTAMGWLGYHLHSFEVAGVLYGDIDDFDGPLGDEDTSTLADARSVTDHLTYDYDFGDGWSHDVRLGPLVDVSSRVTPHLVEGARACPPEDCGGPGGYEALLEALADPNHEDHAAMLEWTDGGFDAEAFDLAANNANLELFDRHTRRR